MDQILLGLGAAGAALLLIAIGVALWEHRRHMAEVRQQLAWAENTRDLLQAHARDMDNRLAGLTAAIEQQRLPPATSPAAPPLPSAALAVSMTGTGGTLSAAAGAAAVTMAAAQAAVTQQWIDTEPMVLSSQVFYGPAPDFDPTQPAELSTH